MSIRVFQHITSHLQLQDALDINLVTQAHVRRCISTYNKVMSSSAAGHTRRRLGNTSTCPYMHPYVHTAAEDDFVISHFISVKEFYNDRVV